MRAISILRVFVLALFTLAASPVDAQMVGNHAVVMFNPQVKPQNESSGLPAVDADFTANGYPYAGGNCATWGHGIPCYQFQSTTRASTAYCTSIDGILSLVATGVLRQCNGNGALIEEARTNDALQSRDMTNASWVKVGIGTALNAIGVDGIANSATTLTASGTAGSCTASCTALQTITLGSSADTYSVYLQRVSGSGAVNITINNLAGSTACTLITTAFTRCTITATLANPIIGIQLTGVNDVVIVDFNQLEPGGFATSPISTTTVAVARSSDFVTPVGALQFLLKNPVGTVVVQTNSVQQSVTNNPRIIGTSSSGNGNFMAYLNFQSTGKITSFTGTTVLATLSTTNSVTLAAVTKTALAWTSSSRALAANGVAATTDANGLGTTTAFPQIGGGDASSTEFLDGYVLRSGGFNTSLPTGTVTQLTQ